MLRRMLLRLLFVLTCSTFFISPAHAFFEEDVKIGNKKVSTVHYHLTRALARCAGFDAVTSETIAGWSQLVDSLSLDLPLIGHIEQNFSVRLGPNDPFFHWPRPVDLKVLERWVMARAPLYECMNRTCTLRRPINTGLITPSHEAFGTYLHSVADRWSHSECIDAGYREHTDADPHCPLDTHHQEFGPEAADRTYQALRAMTDALIWWAAQNNTFSRVAPDLMEKSLNAFVSEAAFESPQARVDIAQSLYDHCTAQDERGEIRPNDGGIPSR